MKHRPAAATIKALAKRAEPVVGLFSSILRSLFGSEEPPSVPAPALRVQHAPVSQIEPRPRQKSALESFVATLPISLPVCGYTVRIARVDNRVAINVSQRCDGTKQPDEWSDPVEATRDEVRAFLPFYLKTPAGPGILTLGRHDDVNRRRLGMVNWSLAAWRSINGPRDKEGRLKKALRCIAWTEGEGPRGHLCWNLTKDVSGLCHIHNKPNARTLWNFNPFIEEEADADRREVMASLRAAQEAEWDAQEKARQAEQKRLREIDDAAWEAKWRPIADRILHTATERQIFYLLDLGVQPSQLAGIDKRSASEMIARLNEEEYERRGWM